MIRILPVALELILLVFCLVDAILADEARVRNLPKWAWILLVVILPLAGGIAWLIAGRPTGRAPNRPVPPPSRAAGHPGDEWSGHRRPKGPDDDLEFLAWLAHDGDAHERMLRRWEEDLRRREEEKRATDDPGASGPGDDAR